MKNHDPKELEFWLPWRAEFWETTAEDARAELERIELWRDATANKIVELLDAVEIFPQILTREYVAADQLFAEDLERDAALIYLEPKRERLKKLRADWCEASAEVSRLETAFGIETHNTIGSIFAPPKPATAPQRRAFD